MADDGWDDDEGWDDNEGWGEDGDQEFEDQLAQEVQDPVVPTPREPKSKPSPAEKAKPSPEKKKAPKAKKKRTSSWSDDDWGNDAGDWLAPISENIDKKILPRATAQKKSRGGLKLGARTRNRANSTEKKLKKMQDKAKKGKNRVAAMEVETPPDSGSGSSSTTRYAFACIAIGLIAGLGIVMLYSESSTISVATSSSPVSAPNTNLASENTNWNKWANQENKRGKKSRFTADRPAQEQSKAPPSEKKSGDVLATESDEDEKPSRVPKDIPNLGESKLPDRGSPSTLSNSPSGLRGKPGMEPNNFGKGGKKGEEEDDFDFLKRKADEDIIRSTNGKMSGTAKKKQGGGAGMKASDQEQGSQVPPSSSEVPNNSQVEVESEKEKKRRKELREGKLKDFLSRQNAKADNITSSAVDPIQIGGSLAGTGNRSSNVKKTNSTRRDAIGALLSGKNNVGSTGQVEAPVALDPSGEKETVRPVNSLAPDGKNLSASGAEKSSVTTLPAPVSGRAVPGASNPQKTIENLTESTFEQPLGEATKQNESNIVVAKDQTTNFGSSPSKSQGATNLSKSGERTGVPANSEKNVNAAPLIVEKSVTETLKNTTVVDGGTIEKPATKKTALRGGIGPLTDAMAQEESPVDALPSASGGPSKASSMPPSVMAQGSSPTNASPSASGAQSEVIPSPSVQGGQDSKTGKSASSDSVSVASAGTVVSQGESPADALPSASGGPSKASSMPPRVVAQGSSPTNASQSEVIPTPSAQVGQDSKTGKSASSDSVSVASAGTVVSQGESPADALPSASGGPSKESSMLPSAVASAGTVLTQGESPANAAPSARGAGPLSGAGQAQPPAEKPKTEKEVNEDQIAVDGEDDDEDS
jgi:predicted RNase H-like HicB family nuclease